jgi:hypothetical protein
MKLGVGCAIILRVHCDSDVTLTVQVGSAAPILLPIPSDRSWTEPMVRVPAELCGGEQVVTVTSPDEEPFSALHYWSIAQ